LVGQHIEKLRCKSQQSWLKAALLYLDDK
jgi:hypothetical protein